MKNTLPKQALILCPCVKCSSVLVYFQRLWLKPNLFVSPVSSSSSWSNKACEGGVGGGQQFSAALYLTQLHIKLLFLLSHAHFQAVSAHLVTQTL